MTYLLSTIIGLIIGLILAYFYSIAQNEGGIAASKEKISILEESITELKQEIKIVQESGDKRVEAERSRVESLTGSLASALANKENLEKKLLEQKSELDLMNKRFSTDFENLANRILDEKTQKFTDQNKSNLDIILNPFKEKLKDFETKVEQVYKAESDERITLKTEIKHLVELNKQVSEEANNLARALQGDNRQQGDWGEIVLERVLERSGLTEDREYKTQLVTSNINGDKIRPDVVIYLPDNKHILVDSKVSLLAYSAWANAVSEFDKTRNLKLHIDSIRNHIKTLSDKHYQTSTVLHSPDFVLLFVPMESSFSLAVQGDAEIFNYAWDKKVVIVSPTTLLATLRTIASIWKQERQTRNVLQIAEEGGKMYDKFVSFYDDLKLIGMKIDDAKENYHEAMKKLYNGTGNLVKRAEKMRELGAKTTKQLPSNIIDQASE